jgi:hypothetical protein
MPGGSLIQLSSFGIEDLYLTDSPSITFFKTIYRRYTNFSTESIPQYFATKANFGEQVTCTISRTSGDLINVIYLYVNLPSVPKFVLPNSQELDPIKKFAWVRNLGFALIKEVSISIDGRLIDRQFGEWMNIWEELTEKQQRGINKMTGNIPELYDYSNGKSSYELFIPLKFWFCEEVGLSLPLIAMASSEVKINVVFRNLDECYTIGPTNSITVLESVVPFKPGDYIRQTISNHTIQGLFVNFDYLTRKLYYIKIQNLNNPLKRFQTLQEPTTNATVLQSNTYANNIPYRVYDIITNSYCTPQPNTVELEENIRLPQVLTFINSFLYVDYVYLDSDERLKFSRATHEYLIEQLQIDQDLNVSSPNVKLNLGLDHPCKEIFFVIQLDSLVGRKTVNDLFNYTNNPVRVGPFNDIKTGSGLLKKASLMLNGVSRFGQREEYYLNLVQPFEHHYRSAPEGLYCYSFSLFPELTQPCGSCNMSKIDFISLDLQLDHSISTINTAKLRVYTKNYNVLRCFYGLAGVAFV